MEQRTYGHCYERDRATLIAGQIDWGIKRELVDSLLTHNLLPRIGRGVQTGLETH